MNQQLRNQQQFGAPRPPQSPEEALQMVEAIAVAPDVFLGWMRRLAPVPSQFGGAVYAEMEQLLARAIDEVARRCAEVV